VLQSTSDFMYLTYDSYEVSDRIDMPEWKTVSYSSNPLTPATQVSGSGQLLVTV